MSLIQKIDRKYNEFHLHIEQMEISETGITALMGSSGSGKTTLLRILLGLELCPGMSWQWGKENIANLATENRHFGVVFQNYDLFSHLTAEQNLQFAGRARNLNSAEIQKEILSLSEQLQFAHKLKQKTLSLSGGERQRVALARALIGSPRMLFLDEPFSALDEDLKSEARNLVKKLVEKTKVPCLLITHDPRDANELAKNVIVLKNGKLVK